MFGESKSFTPRVTLEYPLGHPPERMALTAVQAKDERVILFDRVGNEEPRIMIADNLGEPTNRHRKLEQVYVLHSPTGLEFGYGGSGPADTALNILSLVVSPREAWRMHQDYKADVVARIPREGGTIMLADVRTWIADHYSRELADTAAIAEEQEMRELLAEIEAEETQAAEAE